MTSETTDRPGATRPSGRGGAPLLDREGCPTHASVCHALVEV